MQTFLPERRALPSATPQLPGIDGRKASKSLGQAIPLVRRAELERDRGYVREVLRAGSARAGEVT